MAPFVFHQLFEPESSTFTYILADHSTREAVIIDSVLETAARDEQVLKDHNLKLKWILETHVHADHITGANYLKQKTGALTALSAESRVPCADRLLNDNDTIAFGALNLVALSTPGHTQSCMSFFILDRLFTGDTLLIGGTGRTDFQGGSAEILFDSVHRRIFSFPDSTHIYPAHDYKGLTSTTVGNERKNNPRLGGGKTKADFVKIMAELNLAYPKKIDMALPANMRCGQPV